ncbi:MAG: TetR/AcrR family transcriptional regulator [Sneathiella sp.]|nr:TetR/AcrR family transcriptional regulator [Sneathiella sp.]
MNQSLSKKEQTRRRMLDAASQGFRRHGFAGIGVDGIAKAAGVTSGAFYAHLGSKDAAFQAALIEGLDEVIQNIPLFQRDHNTEWVKAFADYYLGQPHREDLECGCAMASLTPEVVRGDKELHRLYEEKMTTIARIVAKGLGGGTQKNREARAWSMLGVLIGGLNVARGMNSLDIAETIADAIKSAAISAAGQTL